MKTLLLSMTAHYLLYDFHSREYIIAGTQFNIQVDISIQVTVANDRVEYWFLSLNT